MYKAKTTTARKHQYKVTPFSPGS